jgi:hypothetical protein
VLRRRLAAHRHELVDQRQERRVALVVDLAPVGARASPIERRRPWKNGLWVITRSPKNASQRRIRARVTERRARVPTDAAA